ncbi:Di-copper centre-containing protein [Mycena albidolilacea]|uniref:Di-copper centre-containing protein n=1 Tax=Mycena albidolilacea TaxID=1033008 RepID=A0AAD6Z060_9AGAR|nr:Di-copper centre-containing protein [Mycena albidolilacea]
MLSQLARSIWSIVAIASVPLLLGLPQTTAKCLNPSVRREWRSFTNNEKAEWIRAVKCLGTLPHNDALAPTVNPPDIGPVNISGSYYDDFVYLHMDLNIKIHFTGLFLPWHRWYVHVYEGALKSKCNFRGVSPYWDWTKDASNVYESTLLKDASPVHGLGGWGDPNNDYRVPDGAFSSSSSFRLSYPSPHTIRRNFTLQPYMNFPLPGFITDPLLEANATFTKGEIDKLTNGFVGDFKRFQTYFEAFNGSHGGVHNIVGGDLGGTCPDTAPPGCVGGPTFSPNDVLFWLHHAMLDKIWFDWQHKHPANARAFQGGAVEALENVTIFNMFPNGQAPFLDLNSTMPSDGLFPEVKISDVISTTDGILCYIYE